MIAPFRFHPAARAELRDAVDHYDDIRIELGDQFTSIVDDALEHIVNNPHTGEPFDAGTRRYGLTRFPYSIIFLPDRSPIMIVAVPHQRRRPGYWLDRLKTVDES